jgi:hypothetical protein
MSSYRRLPTIRASRCADQKAIYQITACRKMLALENYKYEKRSKLSPITTITDIADYKVGYIFSLWPVTIVKIKTSKIMEAPRYMTVIKIFGTEYKKA